MSLNNISGSVVFYEEYLFSGDKTLGTYEVYLFSPDRPLVTYGECRKTNIFRLLSENGVLTASNKRGQPQSLSMIIGFCAIFEPKLKDYSCYFRVIIECNHKLFITLDHRYSSTMKLIL